MRYIRNSENHVPQYYVLMYCNLHYLPMQQKHHIRVWVLVSFTFSNAD